MINPTLFIGLGSTGKKIIEQFQLLVLEEYGVPGLPIFSYLVFETDGRNDVDVPSWVKNEIELLTPTINNTDAIKQAIRQGQRQYYRGWLDESVLNIPGGQFAQGAGSIRMAGRLCLWENWNNLAHMGGAGGGCATAIRNAANRFAAPNQAATSALLGNLYQKWGMPVPPMGVAIGREPNVYIVGTLCGGTCGGMFIDVAYYVKQIFNLWHGGAVGAPIAKVMGVFTVYDSSGLGGALDAGRQREAANCWASLLEYDYYCHPSSRYQVEFPGGERIIPTRERPLDYAYVLSCSGNGVDMRRADGTADTDSLAHMAAMVLFSESVEGLLGAKEAIRINRLTLPRANTPNENQHMATLATCGLATVWYPKLRITESACCQYVSRLCQDWIGAAPDASARTKIEREAGAFWRATLEAAKTMLFDAADGPIPNTVAGTFADSHAYLMGLNTAKLGTELRLILNDLNQGQRYDNLLNDTQLHETVGERLFSAVESATAAALVGAGNVRRAQEFLHELDTAIARTARSLPNAYPAPDRGRVLERGLSTRLARMAGAVAVERCQAEVMACLKGIRDYRLTGILETLRKKIGVGMKLPEGAVRAGAMSINQRLTDVEKTLRACEDVLSTTQAQMNAQVRQTQDTWPITKSGSVEGDAQTLLDQLDHLAAAVKDGILATAMVREVAGHPVAQPLDEFLGFGSLGLDQKARVSAILDPLLAAVIEEALKHVQTFNIAQQFGNDPAARAGGLALFVKGARPHLQLRGNLEHTPGFFPEFMMGRDGVNVPQMTLLNAALQQCPNPVTWDLGAIKHAAELDHMLLFYKEEALIYMDENLMTADMFAANYQRCERDLRAQPEGQAATRTTHTHRLGSAFFDAWIEVRREEAKRLMSIATDIYSTRDDDGQWTGSEIFTVVDAILINRTVYPAHLQWRCVAGGNNFAIRADDSGIESLAQYAELFGEFQGAVLAQIREGGRQGFQVRLNRFLDWVEAQGADGLAQRWQQQQHYIQVMDEFYPDGPAAGQAAPDGPAAGQVAPAKE